MILLHRLLILSAEHLQEKITETEIFIVLINKISSIDQFCLLHLKLQDLITKIVKLIVNLHAIHAVHCSDSMLHAVDGNGLVGDGGHDGVLC